MPQRGHRVALGRSKPPYTSDVTAVQAIFFDLDATLVDGGSGKAVAKTCGGIAIRLGLEPAKVLAANTRAWEAYWPEVEPMWTVGSMSGTAVTLEAWRRTLAACGCNDESLAIWSREMSSQYYLGSIRTYDDVSGLFDALPADLPLALITNGASDSQREKLHHLDLESRFGAIVISGEVGKAKPDPYVFGLAMEKLSVQPEGVWHIGDSLTTDVAGAKAAGLTAVWLNRVGIARGDGDPRPDHEIGSLTELLSLLPSG
jgi:HAD superfamily hydrolase (TIGR01549 family)